jgi:hypothetical protein
VVEQKTENLRVVGSTPSPGTILLEGALGQPGRSRGYVDEPLKLANAWGLGDRFGCWP